MKYFSMFSGIGGFELGIQNAYNPERIQQRQNIKDLRNIDGSNVSSKPICVGYSEIDKYARQIYKKHFPTHRSYGDATRIDPEQIPDFELLVGGFPCQSFSIAGKRGGFKDTRGTLFFEIARIISTKRPKLLLLENVKGLLSHDNGKTFGTILSTLFELGYVCEWQVLNSKNFGVPQNRERVFVVGHLRERGRQQIFPIRENSEADIVLSTLTTRYKGGQANGAYLREITKNKSQGNRVYDTKGLATTIASQAGGLGAKTGLYMHNGVKIRRLTPTECERLQGFPCGWTEGVSDAQRYKCLGNAVTVNVIEAIIKKIKREK